MAPVDDIFNASTEARITPLMKKLSVKQKALSDLVLSSLNNPKVTAAYWTQLRTEIDILYAEMNGIFASWSSKNIPTVARNQLTGMMATINADQRIINHATKSATAMVQQTAPLSALIYKNANDTFLSALNAGRSSVIQFTRATQQTLLTETQIDYALVRGLDSTGDLRKAAKVLTGDFWAAMLDSIENQQFIQAGRYRYTPEYYSELVARTKFHEAQSMAALTTAKNYDTDLVQVSSHNTKTEICIPYEGNIYSISGTHDKYPPIDDTPPFHPNCLHNIYPIFESAMGEPIDAFY